MSRKGAIVVLGAIVSVLWAVPAVAQTVRADRFVLSVGPCTHRSGSGSPEGVQVGKVCDTWMNTADGQLWTKATGTGNTGWTPVGIGGSGTAGTLPIWTGTRSLGDSSVSEASGNLTAAPTGDIILSPGGMDVLPGAPYSVRLGAPFLQFLSLDVAELHAQTLVAQDVIATIGGMIEVAPTSQLVDDIAPGATTIIVKQNQMGVGDVVFLKTSPGGVPQYEAMAVTSGASAVAGGFAYTVTRNLDGTGANTWRAGDAVLNTGTTGSGLIDIYSTGGIYGGAGPSIVGTVRTGSAFNAIAPRWAVGNMNGWYGYGSNTFGAAFGNPSATNLTIDETNGLRIRSGTTNKLVADTGGNLSIVGDLTVGTSGAIHSAGASSYGSGVGFWMNGGTTPTFRVGTPGGAQIAWDGLNLGIAGDGGGLTNINGGGIQAGTIHAATFYSGSATNMIRNSECKVGTEGWSAFSNTGFTVSLLSNLTSWNLGGLGTCYLYNPGTPAANTVTSVSGELVDVIPGNRYEASAYVGNHRGAQIDVYIEWVDSAGALLGFSAAGPSCIGAVGGQLLNGYCRTGVIATAPTGAAKATIYIQQVHDGINGGTYLFFVRTFFGEATSNQAELSQWGPAGLTEITGGMIRTGSVDANRITANTITASQIAGGTITAAEIAASTITAAKIAAGTITGTQIAGDTITGAHIAANAITASELDADSVTSAKIQAGTIVASDIAANTITADRLSVSSLSAISANLGSITGGSINIGSGNTTIDSSGNLRAVNIRSFNGFRVEGGGSYTSQFDTLVQILGLNPGSPSAKAPTSAFLCVDAAGFIFACF